MIERKNGKNYPHYSNTIHQGLTDRTTSPLNPKLTNGYRGKKPKLKEWLNTES